MANNAKQKRGGASNNVSPEVAALLVRWAGEMREMVYGEGGVPVWGTRFTEIHDQGMSIGHELARLFMEQAVDQQARDVPEDALECEGETADATGETHRSALETDAGEVAWEQPRTRLSKARRDFFPSGQSAGR